MAKSKLGMSSFDIDIKFKDKDEARRYAKRLIEKIRYICKKKNWSATAMVCISNTEGNSTYVHYEHTGKVGRPKKVKEIHPYKSNIEVDWHLHILLVSKPSYAFRKEIKSYIDKNWYGGIKSKDFDVTKLYDKKTYKKNTNIKKAEYFINQADEILFCNYDLLLTCDFEELSENIVQFMAIYAVLDDEDIKIETLNQGVIGEDMLLGGDYFFNVLNKEELRRPRIEYDDNGNLVDTEEDPF